MVRAVEQHHSREQACFREGFSTAHHIQVVNQLQEEVSEYKIPLCFAFVDYEKAFDSIEFTALFKALENQGVDQVTLLSYVTYTVVPPLF